MEGFKCQIEGILFCPKGRMESIRFLTRGTIKSDLCLMETFFWGGRGHCVEDGQKREELGRGDRC